MRLIIPGDREKLCETRKEIDGTQLLMITVANIPLK